MAEKQKTEIVPVGNFEGLVYSVRGYFLMLYGQSRYILCSDLKNICTKRWDGNMPS